MILVDTSGLLAAIDPRQEHHRQAAQVLTRPQLRLLSPFVLAELEYLVARHGGIVEEQKLLRDVARGVYQLESFTGIDVAASMEIIEHYADLGIGLADASIVVLAARYMIQEILTLDQRHFRVIAGPTGEPFRLLPFDVEVT